MAQVTRAVAQGILDGQGYTDNEVRQLAYHWLAAQPAPAQDAARQARAAIEPEIVSLLCGLRRHQVERAMHLLFDYIDAALAAQQKDTP